MRANEVHKLDGQPAPGNWLQRWAGSSVRCGRAQHQYVKMKSCRTVGQRVREQFAERGHARDRLCLHRLSALE